MTEIPALTDRQYALAAAISKSPNKSPSEIAEVAKTFLGFLDPSTLTPSAPTVTMYWDKDEEYPYYRWYKGSIGYLHTPSCEVQGDRDEYTLEELQGEDEGYVRVPAGHVLPDAVKEAIA